MNHNEPSLVRPAEGSQASNARFKQQAQPQRNCRRIDARRWEAGAPLAVVGRECGCRFVECCRPGQADQCTNAAGRFERDRPWLGVGIEPVRVAQGPLRLEPGPKLQLRHRANGETVSTPLCCPLMPIARYQPTRAPICPRNEKRSSPRSGARAYRAKLTGLDRSDTPIQALIMNIRAGDQIVGMITATFVWHPSGPKVEATDRRSAGLHPVRDPTGQAVSTRWVDGITNPEGEQIDVVDPPVRAAELASSISCPARTTNREP